LQLMTTVDGATVGIVLARDEQCWNTLNLRGTFQFMTSIRLFGGFK